MKELIYIGKHQVQGVVSVEDGRVAGLLATGNYILKKDKRVVRRG